MNRRDFLTSLFGVASAAAAVTLLPTSALALPLVDLNDLRDRAIDAGDGSSGDPEAYLQEAQYYGGGGGRARNEYYRRYGGPPQRYRYGRQQQRYRQRCYITRDRRGRRVQVCR